MQVTRAPHLHPAAAIDAFSQRGAGYADGHAANAEPTDSVGDFGRQRPPALLLLDDDEFGWICQQRGRRAREKARREFLRLRHARAARQCMVRLVVCKVGAKLRCGNGGHRGYTHLHTQNALMYKRALLVCKRRTRVVQAMCGIAQWCAKPKLYEVMHECTPTVHAGRNVILVCDRFECTATAIQIRN